jgi:hypothetical protein
LSTGWSKIEARDTESRQKPGEMRDFCLPAGPKSRRVALKVDKNRVKYVIFVYLTLQNRGARTKSRTKSQKIEKMFYSVIFAKTLRSQITGKSQKSRFARNRSQVQ